MKVTALLVSHDGARWLPAVLDGLEAQTRPPDRILAVDTLSKDASVDILQARLGAERVASAGGRSSFGAAVRAGLGYLPPATEDDWIWLLHDDSAPAPDALEALVAAAESASTVSVLGPKLREWPSLRRLLEVGATISGTGRRETGLERGEYDQGQHDGIRDVLAVNTAGMLVRRELLERLGFDNRLPAFGNDIDFGWRAARAGHRTLVVPDAVVFHVEAAHRGLRRTPVTTYNLHRAERSAALYTLLVNGSLRALPFQVLRLFLGSLIRAFGFLLVRAPREAFDELAALTATYLRPGRIMEGRTERRKTATL
ncbi:MAG: glycosyltransferase family 2 protein, partial [Nocardioidaceae bacterium]